jgi:nicotinate-nucleotide adenylyltransferase
MNTAAAIDHSGDQEQGVVLPAPEGSIRQEHEPLVEDLSVFRNLESLLIVGGTFDPFTKAHQAVPKTVAGLLDAQATLYIPANQNPKKARHSSVSNEDRLEMIRGALKEEKQSFVSPLELRREGVSFTVDTLREIRAVLGSKIQLYLFIGGDCLRQLPEWREFTAIMDLVTIVCEPRGENLEKIFAELEGKLSAEQISKLKANVVDAGSPAISATMARDCLGHGELPWSILPPSVVDYIQSRGLYGYRAS